MTWDEALAERWGAAMGKEFFDKGANIQLGPGVTVAFASLRHDAFSCSPSPGTADAAALHAQMCLARVPLNGRNFE